MTTGETQSNKERSAEGSHTKDSRNREEWTKALSSDNNAKDMI
jgi:hypothetical protein